MTGRDLNSINDAFAKATAPRAIEEVEQPKELVTEDTESKEIINEMDPVSVGLGAVGGALATRFLTKGKKRKKDDHADHSGGHVHASVKETGLPDPSRHAGDPLDDEPLEVGDIVEVEGEGSDFVILSVDGDYVSAAELASDGIQVKRDNVTKTSSMSWGGEESVKFERKLVTLKEKKKNMNYTNIMDEYEDRLVSSKFRVREKNEVGKDPVKPDESVGKKKINAKTQRPSGEVTEDGASPKTQKAEEDLQEPVEAAEEDGDKKIKKEEKVVKESINNCNKGNIMSEDKSIFDKLYEQVMGEDDDFELGIGDTLPGDDLGLGDDPLGDEGGEDVTVTLTPDQADAIRAVADQLAPADDEEDVPDEFADDEAPVEDESFEGVEEDVTPTTGAPTSDGKTPGVDPSDGGGKATDVAADSLGGKSTGTGDGKVTDDETTGKETGEGKKPGIAKGAGKPGSQKAKSKT